MIFRYKSFRFEIKKKDRARKAPVYVAWYGDKWIADCNDILILKGFCRQVVNGVLKGQITL